MTAFGWFALFVVPLSLLPLAWWAVSSNEREMRQNMADEMRLAREADRLR